MSSRFIYNVQGLDARFDTQEEAFRQARNLASAGLVAAGRLGKKFEGIRVTRYVRVNIAPDQQEQAPFYRYAGERTLSNN